METYHIDDLNAMDDAQLRAIAEEMGMKKASSEDSEKVLEYILDNQAIGIAKEISSKNTKRQAPKERKPRAKRVKEASDDAAVQQEATPSSDNNDSTVAEENVAPKRKRTPAKTKDNASDEEKPKRKTRAKATAKTDIDEVVLEDAPIDNAEEAIAAEEKPAKRRNSRKKKEESAAAEAANESSTISDNTTPLLPAPETSETAAKQAADSKKQSPDLNSFFKKGKTFTPRAHKEESEPQADAPADAANTTDSIDTPAQPESGDNITPQAESTPAPTPIADTPKQRQLSKKQLRQQQRMEQRQLMQQKRQQQRQPAFNFEGILSIYGVLEVMPEGFGFLRSPDYNYMSSPDDVMITQQQIKRYGLKTGDVVEASIIPPRDNDKHFTMVEAISINGLNPETLRDRIPFEHLTPLFPDEKFDITKGKYSNISTRVVDMFSPIGKGQRALIVAPPKTGKTILLKDIANAIAENHPDTYIIMLLIDERPEEVTDMARSVNAEVIASTFDEPADRHVKIAGMVLEKAKRLVECGHDVVIMLDSITRLARAYNTVAPGSGKILTGGVDANALQRPKRFFGAARNIENGGSLTIIATALTETSSKMDEVIFEEFKGTGNMELQLDRKLANKRIFPAVDITASSTRRDDLLLGKETLGRMWVLRNYLSDMNSVEAMEFMRKRMEMTRSNEELLVTMDK